MSLEEREGIYTQPFGGLRETEAKLRKAISMSARAVGKLVRRAPVAFLDLYLFKTKGRRFGLAATWRCLTITH